MGTLSELITHVKTLPRNRIGTQPKKSAGVEKCQQIRRLVFIACQYLHLPWLFFRFVVQRGAVIFLISKVGIIYENA